MWVFLASDCLFFGALISTYMVYRSNVPVGPGPEDSLTSRTRPSAPSCS